MKSIDVGRSDIKKAVIDVINACHILYNEGMWELFGEGHPSCRIPGDNIVVMPGHGHPFGKSLNDVRSIDDIIFMDLDGNILRKGSFKEAMEATVVHLAIYKSRNDVNGIVYLHPPYTDIFAELNRSIPMYVDDIPIYDSGGEITTMKVAKKLVEKLGEKNAIILRSMNGLVCTGRILPQAVTNAYVIEKNAKHQYHALAIGKISLRKKLIDHRTGEEDSRIESRLKPKDDKKPIIYLYLERKHCLKK